MAKFILVVLFLVVTIPVVSSSQCPDPDYQEWITEDTKCQQQKLGHRYHCLYDIDKDMAIPLCAPAVNCTPGTHSKIDAIGKTVTCTPCSSHMYQPEAKVSYSFKYPYCDRKKQACGTGELQCGEATATHNYKCRCDFSQGMKPSDINKCGCFIKDMDNCQCIEANCDDGEALAANFSCVPIAVPQSTKNPLVSTQDSTTGDLSTGAIVGIVLALTVVAAAIVAGIVMYYRRKTNKMSKTKYENVENGKSSNPSGEPNIDASSTPNENPEPDEAKVSLLPKTEDSEPSTEQAPSSTNKNEAKARILPTSEDSELYNRIKEIFVNSVNPSSLLIRLPLGPSDEEKVVEYIERHGREAGALYLLQTVRRTRPDDWFDCIVKAMKDSNIGLEHIAKKMEDVSEEIKGKQKTETPECAPGDCHKCPNDSGGCNDCNKLPDQETADVKDIPGDRSVKRGVPVCSDGEYKATEGEGRLTVDLERKSSDVANGMDTTLEKSLKNSVQEDGSRNDATERKIAF